MFDRLNIFVIYHEDYPNMTYSILCTTKSVEKKFKGMKMRFEDYRNGLIKTSESYFSVFESCPLDKIKYRFLANLINDKNTIENVLFHINAMWRNKQKFQMFNEIQKILLDNYELDEEVTTHYDELKSLIDQKYGHNLSRNMFTGVLICVFDKVIDSAKDKVSVCHFYCKPKK